MPRTVSRNTAPRARLLGPPRFREIRPSGPSARKACSRSPPLLCQGLEDRPEPFPQPGFGDDLARQVKSRVATPLGMTLLVAALLAASATAEIPKTGGTLPFG